MIMPSAVFAESNADDWELSASWDFAENINNGFTVNRMVSTVNGEGELHWDHNISTAKKYKKAKLEFDFRMQPFKTSERRLMVNFGEESAIGGANFSYTDLPRKVLKHILWAKAASTAFLPAERRSFLRKIPTTVSVT